MAQRKTKKDKKKQGIHFEHAPLQLLVNPKEEEKPFRTEEEVGEDVEEHVSEKDVEENKEEEEVKEEEMENKEDDVVSDTVQEDVDDTAQEDVHHLSVIDKITLGFFVLLNSLGLALKKIYKSIFGFFKREETEQV